ncbi:hypothetical protein NCC78_14740 [Micromonospora phytophila]|uniref:hypothetical protein n=1 Tax=Micromonospora phytophila TaxID=709888 RepID=UPI00202F3553|nr:hypothetical protein [Micromonospora phytophila]MCM0675937.1 hypothetical protein [Micromonospora phytophila]
MATPATPTGVVTLDGDGSILLIEVTDLPAERVDTWIEVTATLPALHLVAL